MATHTNTQGIKWRERQRGCAGVQTKVIQYWQVCGILRTLEYSLLFVILFLKLTCSR